MSLQGPILVVAEQPAADLVAALGAAGAFPIVETNWNDAPTAFVSVKPAAVVIAEAGAPPSEASARMLCLQIATVTGAVVPTLAFTHAGENVALPLALPADPALPVDHAIARLQSAMRVRTLHSTVLRRLDMMAENGATPPALPATDPLDDATVVVAGRGPLYAALGVAMGEHVKMIGALSVEAAIKHIEGREVHGIVIGDGFSNRMIEAFLDALANEPHFRDFPLAVANTGLPDYRDRLIKIEYIAGDPSNVVGRFVPMVRLRSLEMRLTRMLASLDANGSIDPDTGLLTRDTFMHGLAKAVAEAADRSQSLSIARYAFEGAADMRGVLDAARLLTRLTRPVDFACRDDDGSILVAFTETDLREAHMVARRLAADLKAVMKPGAVTANVTLATLKAGDTVDSLMQRVLGSRMVAAE